MAIDHDLIDAITPTVTAAADLRAGARKFVSVAAAGVNLADVRSSVGGIVGVLENKPNTGEDCSIMYGPSVRKVIAGEAVGLGQIVQPMSASGMAGVTSGGNPAKVGFAWQAAAGSGDLFAVKLF
jgi:hypothetical protein